MKVALRQRLYICLQAVGIALLPFPVAAAPASRPWTAQWIASSDGPARDYDIVYFRKALPLAVVPGKFLVDVSADTRYELHVNGRRVGAGPSLADVGHWRYESMDLAPYLHAGQNEIAAIVWNFGTAAPVSQMSSQTAFLMSAEDATNAAINTGAANGAGSSNGWVTAQEPGRTIGQVEIHGYYAAEPQEIMDGRSMQWDWDSAAVNDAHTWRPAKLLGHAAVRGAQDSPTRWILQKDELPPMQYAPVSAGHIVRVSGMDANAAQPATLDHPLFIPAHADVTLLLDRDVLTTAFPSLELTGGKDASVELTYAEALYDDKHEKGNRNQVEGRHIEGISDRIVSDGHERTYRTLWWRTWRYLQVEVKTQADPLTIKKLGAMYTAYPFKAVSSFQSNDPALQSIWNTGWRTAQLCSHETYMDTPYWEQLQYVGDTRIQALISYAVTGDDRLGRQALLAYRDSLLTDGITQSRYPSNLAQVIPPFSLLWIGMLHDYWMYRPDPAFVASLLPATRGVIDWFAARQRADGLIGNVEWWPFVDWSPPTYESGVPPQDTDGGSAALTLQFIEALNGSAELEDHFGQPERAAHDRELAKRASDGLMRLDWNQKAGLMADTPAKKTYSQQANSLAVWLDVIPKEEQRAVMQKVLDSASGHMAEPAAITMGRASYYFRFYVARAMVHAGLGNQYIAMLDPWRKMLQLGLSTWAETPEPTRSDSHAWSAHPTLDLLTLVAGIAPDSPGFGRVRITPHLGPLQNAAATMITPKGLVVVRYIRTGEHWSAKVVLPDGLPGDLEWNDTLLPLHAGEQTLELP